MDEYIITLVVNGDMADPETTFQRVFNAACNCRKHWWQWWKPTECAVAFATVYLDDGDDDHFNVTSIRSIKDHK